MRRTKFGLLVAALAVLAVSCGDDLPTTPTPPSNVYVNQSVIVGQPAQPGAGGACGASDPLPTSLSVSTLDGSGQISVAGGAAVLNATPKPLASDQCNESRGITWAVVTPTTCALTGDLTSFTPKLMGRATGVCTVQAVVMGVSGALSLPVVP